ncbi:hypothetical protein GW17_00029606 [Ensete ventricosum]|nr:hypothetical protein GW17_00029606 [Ensete ventricosum]
MRSYSRSTALPNETLRPDESVTPRIAVPTAQSKAHGKKRRSNTRHAQQKGWSISYCWTVEWRTDRVEADWDPGEVVTGVKEERKLLQRGAQGKREGEGRGGLGYNEEGRCFIGRSAVVAARKDNNTVGSVGCRKQWKLEEMTVVAADLPSFDSEKELDAPSLQSTERLWAVALIGALDRENITTKVVGGTTLMRRCRSRCLLQMG